VEGLQHTREEYCARGEKELRDLDAKKRLSKLGQKTLSNTQGDKNSKETGNDTRKINSSGTGATCRVPFTRGGGGGAKDM